MNCGHLLPFITRRDAAGKAVNFELMPAVVEAGTGTPSIQQAINSHPKSSPASGHKNM
jgi:hypothetical protein